MSRESSFVSHMRISQRRPHRVRAMSGTRVRVICVIVALGLFAAHEARSTVHAKGWPSLFRGVVVADSQVGIRVVRVEDASQAHLADLRPEDIIVRVNGPCYDLVFASTPSLDDCGGLPGLADRWTCELVCVPKLLLYFLLLQLIVTLSAG